MIPRPPRSPLFPTRRSSDLPYGRPGPGFGAYPIEYEADSPPVASRAGGRSSRPCWRYHTRSCSRSSSSRSEEHTSELQSHVNLVCRLLLEKKKKKINTELDK